LFPNSAEYSLESVCLSTSGSPSKHSSHSKQLNCLTCSNIDPPISILERTKCFPLNVYRKYCACSKQYSEIWNLFPSHQHNIIIDTSTKYTRNKIHFMRQLKLLDISIQCDTFRGFVPKQHKTARCHTIHTVNLHIPSDHKQRDTQYTQLRP
jgi:hypothetical protein